MIQNLFRDGYAAWALLVVQGEGLDLYFNKRKLNKMLPPRFSVIRASVKKLKWQMSLMALGESKYVDGVVYLWVFLFLELTKCCFVLECRREGSTRAVHGGP